MKKVKIKSTHTITTTDIHGNVTVETYKNVITSAGREALLTVLTVGGGGITSGINYFALGTGTTPPTEDDTGLEAESSRYGVTTVALNFGILTVTTELDFADGNGTWGESGEIIDGTSTLGTGTLWARWLSSFTKDSSQQKTIKSTYQLTI